MKIHLKSISTINPIGNGLSVIDPQGIETVEKPYTQTLEYNDSNNK